MKKMIPPVTSFPTHKLLPISKGCLNERSRQLIILESYKTDIIDVNDLSCFIKDKEVMHAIQGGDKNTIMTIPTMMREEFNSLEFMKKQEMTI